MPQPYSAPFSVAPMMDWTDRRCRAFHRLMSRRARLYTEMVTADAIVFGPRERLIGFDPCEHPVALQLGGSDPARLVEAAQDRRRFRLRRDQPQLRLPVGSGAERPVRRLPHARAGPRGRMRRRDGRGGRHAGHREVPHRDRRSGAARSACLVSPRKVRAAGAAALDRPRAQGVARRPEPEG